MNQRDRAVTPAISTILMVAIVVILAAVISVSVFGAAEDLREPAPNVADTTGEFEVGSANPDNQVVQITHIAGDNVNVENIEIIVRASGPGDNLPTEARLVDLPSDGYFDYSIDDDTNVEGNKGLISGGSDAARIIVVDDTNTWSAGDTIQFEINVGGADFRDSAQGDSEEADTLEVIIVHTPSNAILSEHTFTP
jgi:flagellin-like protein